MRLLLVSQLLPCLALFLQIFLIQSFALRKLTAAGPPVICPGGTALGRFDLTVVRHAGGTPRSIQNVNRILAGDTISYRPADIDSPEKKKLRISLLLVPSDGSKIVVFDPQPGDKPATWKAPFRAQLASLVWGPEGLDKAKVASLVTKNDELIGQLADYAAKTAETQVLLGAIEQQQALATGEDVGSAVAGFAGQYPSAKLDRNKPTDVQLGVLIHSVNPSLSAYDPLVQNPQQQAAQTAGLAAAVAGLFFGNGVGLAATGGTVLVNLHSLLFPHTEFLSALAQADSLAAASTPPQDDSSAPDPASAKATSTGLCGSKPSAVAHTEFAFLWALRFPDVPAPALSLPVTDHLPIGVKSSVALQAKVKDWKLMPRVQDWRLVSQDNATSIPIPAKVNTTAKTIELDLTNAKLKAGTWKLAANWDWDPIEILGAVVLHNFSVFASAHLTSASQDELMAGAGTLDLELGGDDFEFVHKIGYKKLGDPFAEPQTLPFHLPKEPPTGPETSLEVRLDAKTLTPGNYVFQIAQTDGKVHETPFKVLRAAPSLSGTPVVLNTGVAAQTVVLRGTGLDRIEQVSTDGAQITLGDSSEGDQRSVTVSLAPGAKQGTLLALKLKVTNFEELVSVPDVFLVGGPRPAITTVRESLQEGSGIALNAGEMAMNSLVSFEVGVLNASVVSEIDLSCENSPDSVLKIKNGETKDGKLTREAPDLLFLLFHPESVGPSGCNVMAALITPKNGQSNRRKLGAIVLLPKIDSFEMGNEKAADSSYFASLEGHDLENIAKVGWDAQNGTPVDSIPTPVPGPGNRESLRVAMPWPAPSPHAAVYIWLRGETTGRLTSAKY